MPSVQTPPTVTVRKAEAGLKLKWFIPEENRMFTTYAKDEAQKAEWIARALEEGWRLFS